MTRKPKEQFENIAQYDCEWCERACRAAPDCTQHNGDCDKSRQRRNECCDYLSVDQRHLALLHLTSLAWSAPNAGQPISKGGATTNIGRSISLHFSGKHGLRHRPAAVAEPSGPRAHAMRVGRVSGDAAPGDTAGSIDCSDCSSPKCGRSRIVNARWRARLHSHPPNTKFHRLRNSRRSKNTPSTSVTAGEGGVGTRAPAERPSNQQHSRKRPRNIRCIQAVGDVSARKVN